MNRLQLLKITPLALVALLLTAVFAIGCRGSDPAPGEKAQPAQAKEAAAASEEPPGEPVEVLLWHAYRAGEREAIEATIAQFNKSQTGVVLKALAVPFDALNDKITAAVPRGHGPDLFIFAHNRIGDWADMKIVEPIGYWANDDLLNQYFDITVRALVYKGGLYGLPLAYKSLALFYNKDLVTETPATLEELFDHAKKLTNRQEGIYGLAYENAKLYFTAPFFHAFGAEIINAKDDVGLDTPEAKAAMNYVARFHNERVMPEEITSFLVTSLFNQGKAAMVVNGPWFLTEIDEGVNFGVAPLPAHNDNMAAPLLGSEGVMMSARSENKEAAFQAMKYLASDEAAAIRLKVGRQTVANKAVYEDPEVASDPILNAFREQLQHTIPMNNTPKMQLVWSTMDTAIFRVIKGGVDSEIALNEAAEKIRRDWERATK